jgi:uncharacterized RDD family membrane protein YckC
VAAERDPSIIAVETPEAVTFQLELAGIGSRGLALLTDTTAVLLIVAGEFIVFMLAAILLAEVYSYFTWWILAVFAVVAFVTYWGYFIYGEVFRSGRTWGKRLLGLRVVKDDGSQVGFVDSAIRNFLRIADMLPGSYAIGLASALLSEGGKRLGDHAAGTIVVVDPGELTLYFEGDVGEPQVALAREYLDRRAELTPAARGQVADAVLRAAGEDPTGLDESAIAARLSRLVAEEAVVYRV